MKYEVLLQFTDRFETNVREILLVVRIKYYE
jgi:hypothetical protein